MAVVAPSIVVEKDSALVTWAGLLNGDTGGPVDLPAFPDRTFQVIGTFGVGGSVTMEGSNAGAVYAALTDPQGNAITKTAAAIETVVETPKFSRPNVTAGDGTTSITVSMYCRRSMR